MTISGQGRSQLSTAQTTINKVTLSRFRSAMNTGDAETISKTIVETEGGKPMSDLQAIADRVEIEALRGEFVDAGMMRDYDRFASLFTQDAVWRIPVVNVEFVGREEIRAGIERLGEGLWDYLVQTTHPGTIQLEGDTASGRAYVLSFGHMRDGSSHLNYSLYHDRYRRTPEGWKFTERADEIRYLDTTPLAGSPPQKTTTTGGTPRSA